MRVPPSTVELETQAGRAVRRGAKR